MVWGLWRLAAPKNKQVKWTGLLQRREERQCQSLRVALSAWPWDIERVLKNLAKIDPLI